VSDAESALMALKLETPVGKRAAKSDETRTKLLDAAEKIIIEQGYASISSRNVATLAGVTGAVVHYYFPSLTDLLVELYKRTSEGFFKRLVRTVRSTNSAREIWNSSRASKRTPLFAEYIALANHKKELRVEIARNAKLTRGLQAEAISELIADAGLDLDEVPPLGVAFLLGAVARSLSMEEAVDIDYGHAEAITVVDWLLKKLEPGTGKVSVPAAAEN
jgi:AcrR family transcriptional regulator